MKATLSAMCEEQHQPLEILKEEAGEFISKNLKLNLPETHEVDIEWINQLIQAFQEKQPFQNITLLNKISKRSVPGWEDIYRDIIQEGKGGLCLSLNFALATLLRAIGVCAHTLSADYVAREGRGVHALTVIHIPKINNLCRCCLEICGSSLMVKNASEFTNRESGDLTRRSLRKVSISSRNKLKFMAADSLYVADVGCGFPSLRTINLSHDLDRIFVECGLEYRFTRKGQRYLRLHRAGDVVPEGEEDFVNEEGWRAVFSFALIPRTLAYFHRTMRPIYVSRMLSPYFTELHVVRYFSQNRMIAVKNKTLITSFSCQDDNLATQVLSGDTVPVPAQKDPQTENELSAGSSTEGLSKNRKVLKEDRIFSVITEHFPMIPGHEVKKAVCHFLSVQDR